MDSPVTIFTQIQGSDTGSPVQTIAFTIRAATPELAVQHREAVIRLLGLERDLILAPAQLAEVPDQAQPPADLPPAATAKTMRQAAARSAAHDAARKVTPIRQPEATDQAQAQPAVNLDPGPGHRPKCPYHWAAGELQPEVELFPGSTKPPHILICGATTRKGGTCFARFDCSTGEYMGVKPEIIDAMVARQQEEAAHAS